MFVVASLGVLACLASLLADPTSIPTEDRSMVERRSAETTSSATALPPAGSPFVAELENIPLDPLAIPMNNARSSASAGAATPRAGWVKRVVTDWLHRGNRSEPAADFFSRLRKEQKQASDSLLVSRCRALLLADPSLRSLFIHVSSAEGVIELRGHVPTDGARQDAERIARNTPGVRDIRNSLSLATANTVQQATYVGASLLPPLQLDGESFERGSNSVTAGSAVSSPVLGRPAAMLGADIESISEATLGFDSNRTRAASPEILPTLAMPPVRHQTVGQTVAKAPVAPEVLPSGHRLWVGSGRRPPIPAPPSNIAVQAPPVAAQGQPIAPSSPTNGLTTREQALSMDVAAVLKRDPRASQLTSSLRASEVRLSGQTRTPEDLYSIADLLSKLPGVDFVSFDAVTFAP